MRADIWKTPPSSAARYTGRWRAGAPGGPLAHPRRDRGALCGWPASVSARRCPCSSFLLGRLPRLEDHGTTIPSNREPARAVRVDLEGDDRALAERAASRRLQRPRFGTNSQIPGVWNIWVPSPFYAMAGMWACRAPRRCRECWHREGVERIHYILVLTPPIETDTQLSLYERTAALYDEVPGIKFEVHVLNPEWFMAGDALSALPPDAHAIALPAA